MNWYKPKDEKFKGWRVTAKKVKVDGQATGIAMGFMKKHNPQIPIDGKDVAEAVKMMRK